MGVEGGATNKAGHTASSHERKKKVRGDHQNASAGLDEHQRLGCAECASKQARRDGHER